MRQHLFRMHEAVLRAAPLRPGDRVLYLGSNSPALSTVLAEQLARGGELVGIDFGAPTLSRAEELLARSGRKNMAFFRLVAPAIPYPEDYFDWVIAFGGFERFPELDRTMGELARVLKPGGQIYWHDVSTSLEGLVDKCVQTLLLGRRPSRAHQAFAQLSVQVSSHFELEFSRSWHHAWGKRSCLLVGRKPD